MTTDLSKLSFLSTLNYLKRDSDLVGTAVLTLGAFGATTSTTINHNLGYIPFVSVAADVNGDGFIWSNEVVNLYTQTSLSGASPLYPRLNHWVTPTQLVISLINQTSPVQTGTRPVYWAIYLDYDS